MNEEYRRTRLLIGEEPHQRIRAAKILVFGIGGVGSHCVEALARSGVGTLILVDNDVVSLSNINRQAVAYHSTVNRHKTTVMKEKIHDICPEIEVITYEEFALPDNIERFFTEPLDYVIDAVDTVTAKLAIIEQAQKRGIPVISSMGTGNKLHPELFEVTALSKTTMCPLCKVMRREVKARNLQEVKVVYSPEQPLNVNERLTAKEREERRGLPGSIAFVPPVAGLIMAGEVLRELAQV